jgi:integrase
MGEGSVFVRKETKRTAKGAVTRYRVVAAVREGGRWRQRSLGAWDRRRDAERAAREERRRLEALGAPGVEAAHLRLADWCAEWLAAGRWRPKTRAWYEANLARWVLPHLGERHLRDLRRPQVEAWLRRLEADGASRATLSGAHRTLRTALAAAVREGLIATNHAAAMKVPGAGSRANAAWPPEALAAFLAAAAGSRHYPMLRFLAATGCRLGEAAGLCWDKVDLEAGAAVIDRTLVWVRGRPVRSEPKTARGRRRVSLGPGTVEVLRTWRAQQAAERLEAGAAWGGEWRDANLVFTTSTGRPVEPSALRRAMVRIARRAGLPPELRVHPHALRHTAATLALSAGEAPALVAAELGHDTGVLLSVYTDAVADTGRVSAVVEALAQRGRP